MPNKMWRNSVSGLWANAVAWSPGGAPGAADSAFVTILPDVAIRLPARGHSVKGPSQIRCFQL
jgi:hypothetical protein